MESHYQVKKEIVIISVVICIIFIIFFDILSIVRQLKMATIFITLYGGWAIIMFIINFKNMISTEFILSKDKISISQCSKITRYIEFKNITSIKYGKIIIYEYLKITEENNRLPVFIDVSISGYREIYKQIANYYLENKNIFVNRNFLKMIDNYK